MVPRQKNEMHGRWWLETGTFHPLSFINQPIPKLYQL